MNSFKCACLSREFLIVEVQSAFIQALPGFSIVGLGNTSIKESELRVKSALLNSNFKFPPKKIIINLSPANEPKNGSHFDLAIALLIALNSKEISRDFYVFGELSLDGEVKSTTELFSLLLFLSSKVKNAKCIVPKDIAKKASMIPNLEIFAVSSLKEAIIVFENGDFESRKFKNEKDFFKNCIEINGEKFIVNSNFLFDFKDIKGQNRAKRASLIAAAGMHNIIYEGSAGCGKSMCAKRLVYILPPQSVDEILLKSAYDSLNEELKDFDNLRSFRAPHHTSTKSSIFGGGTNRARIGEIALANNGILFFDEIVHFPKAILQSLREPLEDNYLLISRVNSKIRYETKFLFVGALNPCPCGNAFSNRLNCRCSILEIKRYKSSLSAPLLDRIDIYVQMDEIKLSDKSDVTSKQMQDLVLKAFKMQKLRKQSDFNGKLKDEEIVKFCVLDKDSKYILDKAVQVHALSQRAINKALKVARTIADLDEREYIVKRDLIESLSFRIKE